MAKHEGKHRRAQPGEPERGPVAVVSEPAVAEPAAVTTSAPHPQDHAVHVSVIGSVADRLIVDEWLRGVNEPRYVVTGGQANLPLPAPDALVVLLDGDDAASWAVVSAAVGAGGSPPLIVVGGMPGATIEQARRAKELDAIAFIDRSDLSAPVLQGAIQHALDVHRLRRALDGWVQRFDLMIRGANDGLWEWDVAAGTTFFSQRWRHVLGYQGDESATSIDEWFARVHPGDVGRLRVDFEAHLQGRTPVFENEHRVRSNDGAYRWVLSRGLALRDASGTVIRMAGSVTNVSDYRAREQAIRHQSRHDSWTGLPRREPFVEHLARAVELAEHYDDFTFEVLLIEVDRLRMVNQSIGHNAGDILLAKMARRLEGCLDGDQILARFGGSKFAILLQDVADLSVATALADRIHRAFEEPFEIDAQPVYVTANIGITSSARRYTRVEDVISDVIAAASKAKNRFVGRHEFFSADMRVEALSKMRLEMSLRQAVERDEFIVHYQPIVSLDQGTLLGFEALVRWNHPRHGLVPPLEFIPLAESTGLILPIGSWVLEESVRQLSEWHKAYEIGSHLTMSVNLSGRQIADPDLFQKIEAVLQKYNLPPAALKVELTESVVMENAEAATRLLDSLRRIGVAIWVDDFGTGYSSLSYLHRFPVDGLKIDKTFIDELDGTKESEAMVRTIVGLAYNLGLNVVAEGIERPMQAEQLRRIGCSAAQGFFFGMPQAASEATKLLAVEVDS